MADSSTVIRNLQKKKYTRENIEHFSRYMMNSEKRMAMLQMALNYPMFYESISELEQDADSPACLKEAGGALKELIEVYVVNDCSQEEAAKGCEAAAALRSRLTDYMKTLSAYGDWFNLYEYVLNRREYNYRDSSHIAKLGDQELTQKIMEYLSAEADNQTAQLYTVQMLTQLPMRMTKKRFFQIVEDGLRVYIGSEKRSVMDLVEMLRQSAVGEEPDSDKLFVNLSEAKESIAAALEQDLDAEKFEAVYACLEKAFLNLNSYMDCVMLEQEVVNDLYIVLLTRSVTCQDLIEKQNCIDIFEQVNQCFENPERPEIGDSLDELFMQLEGIQEYLHDQLENYESVLEGLPLEIGQPDLDETLKQLRWCVKLHSTSIFVELEQQADTSKADEAYVMETAAKLCLMYQQQFARFPKMMVRGIMSAALGLLPLFVRTYSEVEEYVSTSLLNCTDAAEKAASTELLLSIMEDTKW